MNFIKYRYCDRELYTYRYYIDGVRCTYEEYNLQRINCRRRGMIMQKEWTVEVRPHVYKYNVIYN